MAAQSDIAKEILNYLSRNPEANDTLEGITEWWLLSRKVSFEMRRVKTAISNLIKDGWIIETRGKNSSVHYRLNPKKRAEINRCL